MLVGVATALLTWPKDQSTNSVWFWVRAVGFPPLTFALLFGFRQLYFEQETERTAAESEQLAVDRAEAIRFAREPLAILGHAYLTALASNDAARRIAGKERVLESQKGPTGSPVIRHTVLACADNPVYGGRFEACFAQLLERLDDALQALPGGVPLEVYLQVPPDEEWDALHTAWQTCWTGFKHRPVEVFQLSQDDGVMALDAWLDIYGGPQLEKFALFVAVQLHATPQANGAEAATALLVGWAPLAERKGLAPQALLHRPVEADANRIQDAVSRALLWGNTEAAEVFDLWQAGMAKADKAALLKASSDLKSGVSQTDSFSGLHDIDVAIGEAGVSAAWLAIALAAEHAAQTAKPQIVASRQSTLRLAVVQPAGPTQEAGQE